MIQSVPRPQTDQILSVSNLCVSFRQHDGSHRSIVKNVTFDIAPHETVAVVGESGSGKSVTAMSIMRLFAEPAARITGEVKLQGRNLLELSEPAMRSVRGDEIAMIFQEPMTSLNPLMTVGTQISEVLIKHRGLSRERARAETIQALDRVRIPNASSRFDEYPHRLSGGMRQRVMIAMALACKPKLLIADEPTTALDVTIQAQTLSLMKMLQEEEGMGILFITHDMGVVAEIADRTLVMLNGSAVESGTTADIFARCEHPYTRALLSAVPRLGSMQGQPQPLQFPVVDPETGQSTPPPQRKNTVASDEAPLLQVRNLVTRYPIRRGFLGRVSGNVHAVESVSFDLRRGETLALVGESGCGKSTIGRSVLRLIEPQQGEIQLQGRNIMTVKEDELRRMRRSMQLIFQDPFASLDPRYSIGSAVAEPLLTHGLARHSEVGGKVSRLLERVGLGADMAARFPHELSGGQRQRISIARALALEPAMIVADEAVSALDVTIKAQVINLLLDLQESLQLAYIFISHDMAVVERISHRVAVMYLGEIVEIGTREAIFGNPQHPYTRKLLEAVPKPDPARRRARADILQDEIASSVRPLGYAPPQRRYVEVSDGHFVETGTQTAWSL